MEKNNMSYQRSTTDNHLYIWMSESGLHVATPHRSDMTSFIHDQPASDDNAKALFLGLYDYLLDSGFRIEIDKEGNLKIKEK